jgi:LmbE family N-acetylglucosaminyl deacetylase
VKRNRVAVIAAHPDDEVLGCGGTIARHSKVGDEVAVLILAEGVTSRKSPGKQGHNQKLELAQLGKAARAASKILGVYSLELHSFPDNRMDSVDLLDIIKRIEEFMTKHRPSIVYSHHAGDVNIDHRRIHEAVVAACRPIPGHFVKQLLFFETPSSTEWQLPGSMPAFLPNWFVDISGTWETKKSALQAYAQEMRPWPHPRSIEAIEALGKWRGSSARLPLAESFMLGRFIQSETDA